MTIVAGVDEAGRGSVLGPLVVACVALKDSKIPELKKIGVKDSKLLTPKVRRKMYREIKQIADRVVVKKVEPLEIDRVVFAGQKLFRLNYLEAQAFAYVLHKIGAFDSAYVDCCDVNQTRFRQLVCDLIAEKQGKVFTVGEPNPLLEKVISEHHADRNYPVVSAASIIAKVTRDRAIKRIAKIHGALLGSGYPSDPETLSFLNLVYEKSKSFPEFTRLSWATVRRIKGEVVEEEELTFEKSVEARV